MLLFTFLYIYVQEQIMTTLVYAVKTYYKKNDKQLNYQSANTHKEFMISEKCS